MSLARDNRPQATIDRDNLKKKNAHKSISHNLKAIHRCSFEIRTLFAKIVYGPFSHLLGLLLITSRSLSEQISVETCFTFFNIQV
jgi:hypothetical protein